MALPIGFAELNEATERGRKINELLNKVMSWRRIESENDLPEPDEYYLTTSIVPMHKKLRDVLFESYPDFDAKKLDIPVVSEMWLGDDGWYEKDGETLIDSDVKVTAWMELPPPYEDK